MPLLNDWTVQLQFDDSKVVKGIQDLEKRIKDLERAGKGLGNDPKKPNRPKLTPEEIRQRKIDKLYMKAVLEDRRRTATSEKRELQKMENLHSRAIIHENEMARRKEKRMEMLHSRAIIEDRARTRRAEQDKIRSMDRLHMEAIRMNKQVDRERIKAAKQNPGASSALRPITFEGRRRQRRSIEGAIFSAESSIAKLGDNDSEAAKAAKRGLRREITRLIAAQKRLQSITFSNTDAYRGLVNSVDASSDNVKRLNKQVTALNSRFRAGVFAANGFTQSLRNMARSYLSLFAVFEGTRFVGKTLMDLEAVKSSMLAASGDAQTAAEDFAFVRETTFALGNDLLFSAKGFQQIGTAARAAGMDTKQTKELFLAASEGAVAFGLSVEDTAGVYRAFSQILSKGNVQAEELRGQLGDRLFGAFQLYAKSLGISTEELNDQLRKGLIKSETLLGFARTLRETARETGALEAGLGNSRNALNRLKSAFTVFLENVFGDMGGLSSIFNSLAQAILDVTPLVKALMEGFKFLFNVIVSVVSAIDSVIKALGFDSGALGAVVIVLVGLLAKLLIPAFAKAGWAAIGAFSQISTGAMTATGAVSRLAAALIFAKRALTALLLSTGVGALVVGAGALAQHFLTPESDNELMAELDKAKAAIDNPKALLDANRGSTQIVNNFGTVSDPQEITRIMKRQLQFED